MKNPLNSVRIYDNGGKTADRFTAVFMAIPEAASATFYAVGMDNRPFHPQGVCITGTAMPGRHLGRRIAFDALPADCQRLVFRILSEA